MRLSYGPASYFRLGAVWPRLKLREPWPAKKPTRWVRGAVAPPITPDPPLEQDLTPAMGLITPHEDHLRDTLASLTQLQTWMGVLTEAAAKKRIFVGDIPPPVDGKGSYQPADLIGLRPFCVLYTDPQAGYTARKVAADLQWRFVDSGRLVVMFEQEVPHTLKYDAAELRRQFMNSMGLIAQELLNKAGQGEEFATRHLTVYGPYRGDEDDIEGQGDPIVAYFDLDWGNV